MKINRFQILLLAVTASVAAGAGPDVTRSPTVPQPRI